jgi:arylformamidase
MPIYDISQTIDDKIAVWPGDQKFRHRWSMRIEKGDSCNVSAVTMSVHTGTHLDAPYHFDDAGHDIGSVPLQLCLGPARVVAVPAEGRRISAPYLERLDWKGVERILFRTISGETRGDRFERDFVCLAEDGAEFLIEQGLRLVGTDAPSVDAYSSKSLRCHRILHARGIAILEGVCLAHTPPGDYELICLPLKLSGLDGSPVRAVLRRPD